jgi:acetyltransferase
VIQGALAESRASLTESESKDVLAAYGVPVIQTHLAASPEEAAQIAGRIGLPVALTLMSRDIRRKWDVGGVALNLESTEAVEVAARGMIERAGRAEPPVSVSGFTVQRMVMRGHARQLLIGVSTDRLFGPVIVFGEGGRALEIFRGLAVGLPPLNKPLADDLITRSKAAALLEARGHLPAADRDALALTLTKVSQIVVDHPEIHEMDINPVFVDEHGVQALDAHMRLRPATAHEHRLAIQPYPKALEEPSQLRDGRPILLRPIRPEDEPAHYAFLSRLTREDFIYRFFNYIPEFPRREMARLTQIDYDREMAFIATATGPDGKPETLGVSRAVADPDNHTAEFALVIRSDLKRQRLGSILMDKLVRYAREIGIQRLVGEVMGENEPMLGLLKHLGFKLRVLPGDGYADYAKPFRVREDICVTGCALACLFAEGRAGEWPAPWAQRCVAAIAGLESCSRLDPDDARTHIVTAGTLSFAGAVIRESEQHWRDDQIAARDRWQRDRSILDLGKEARRQRAIKSWLGMGRTAQET